MLDEGKYGQLLDRIKTFTVDKAQLSFFFLNMEYCFA